MSQDRMGRLPPGTRPRVTLVVLLYFGLAHSAGSQVPPPFEISVNVNLVVLHATVRDGRGRVVSNLREQEFAVYEDGVRQSIRVFRYEDLPVSVGLVVDHSGSMRRKLDDVVAAARTFVRTSNPEDEMFVVNFNDKVTLGLPAGVRFTNRVDELTGAISNTRTEGRTALYDASIEALTHLRAGSRNKKVMIVISDGADNASVHSLKEVLQLTRQSSTIVYTIGIADEEDPDRNPNLLKRLARETGGDAYFPGKLSEVVAICERIARDIRSQYTIGYVSTSEAAPGVYRSIRVAAAGASHGKLNVRTRTGYVGGSSRNEAFP